MTEDEVNARDLVLHHIDPILRKRMDVSLFYRYWHLEGTLPRAEAEAVSDVPADFETIGAFASRLYWQHHIIREFDGPAAEVQRILGLIDRSVR